MAWSYSRLKNFEVCPLKHQQVDLLKAFKEPPSEQLEWGDQVHLAMKNAAQGKAPLPATMQMYQKWLEPVIKRPAGVELLVEQNFALDADLQPCEYYGPKAWFRIKIDLILLGPKKALVLDWKTGKPKDDSPQLMLSAQSVFSFFPQIEVVDSSFVWLQFDAERRETYTREDVAGGWVSLLERVRLMEQAAKLNNYPPKPSGICRRYCPVISCAFHGKNRS